MRATPDVDTRFTHATQALLANPFIDRSHDAWADVVVERDELRVYFDELCGWLLNVDVRAGFARLYKRRRPDPTRPLLRVNDTAMTSEGYALLMVCAAELITRPTTSLSDLARNLEVAAIADSTLPSFDPTVHRHRLAFVDAVRWLEAASLVRITAGNVDGYADGESEAVIVADPLRFSQMLASSTPPSRIRATDTGGWIDALCDEPRYQESSSGQGADRAVRLHARHMLARELIDDPALHTTDHDGHVLRYLTSGEGRARLVEGARRAGYVVELSADCIVAVDTGRTTTDRVFGASDTVTQVAAALLAHLSPERRPGSSTLDELEVITAQLLADDTKWAVTYQRRDGAVVLTAAALDVLIAFDLVTIVQDGGTTTITTRPSAGRYSVHITDNRSVNDADAPSAGLASGTEPGSHL